MINHHQHRRRRVCLFGTSADPPTGIGGHLGIVKYLASSTTISTSSSSSDDEIRFDFDQVRVLPVYKHMFQNKRERGQAPFHQRMEMCELCFADVPNVVVSDAERMCFERYRTKKEDEGLENDNPTTTTTTTTTPSRMVGTADILDMLIENEPDVDFTWAIGEDAFIDLASGKWKRAEDIFRLLGHRIIVFRRSIHYNNNAVDEDGIKELPTNDNNNDNNETEQILRDCVTKWSLHRPIGGTAGLNGEAGLTSSSSSSSSSSIKLVHVPTLSSNVSSSAARATSDETILNTMLSKNVLDYIRHHCMYSFSGI